MDSTVLSAKWDYGTARDIPYGDSSGCLTNIISNKDDTVTIKEIFEYI